MVTTGTVRCSIVRTSSPFDSVWRRCRENESRDRLQRLEAGSGRRPSGHRNRLGTRQREGLAAVRDDAQNDARVESKQTGRRCPDALAAWPRDSGPHRARSTPGSPQNTL